MSDTILDTNGGNGKSTRFYDLPEAKDAIIGLMEISNALGTLAHAFETGSSHGDFKEMVEYFEGFQGVLLALYHRHRSLVTALDIGMDLNKHEEESDAAV